MTDVPVIMVSGEVERLRVAAGRVVLGSGLCDLIWERVRADAVCESHACPGLSRRNS